MCKGISRDAQCFIQISVEMVVCMAAGFLLTNKKKNRFCWFYRLSHPLVLLSSVAYSTLEFAKSQLEWMTSAITEAFERDRDNPFQTR